MSDYKKPSDALPPGVVIFIALIYGWTSYDYDAASRMMPRAVAGLAIVLSLIELLSHRDNPLGRGLRGVLLGEAAKPVAGLDGQAGQRHSVGRELAAFGWIAGFVVLALLFGFYLAIPVYVFTYLKFYARKSAAVSAAMALGLVAFLYLTFQILLGYEIFSGMILGDFI